MLRLGLTGGIASGKSTVTAMLRELGALIIDADKVARKVVEPYAPAWHDIVKAFGSNVLLPNDFIDRKLLGEIVFNNPQKLKQLEDIIHPKIREEFNKQMADAEQQGAKIVVLDIPLLIETDWKDNVDLIWLVYVDEKTQLARLQKRDNLTYDRALQRIKKQIPLKNKIKHAQVVINNEHDIDNTRSQVVNAWNNLIKGCSMPE